MEGPLPLIQLTTGEVRWSLVEPTADGRIVHAEVAPLHLRMREAQVVGWRQARLEGRPGEAGQPLVDPAPLLELPASPLPDPRRQRRVTFRIGGEEHQVEGLLAVEISRVEPLPPAQASGPWADEVERARTASRSTWELAHRLMALASRRVRPTPVRAQGPTQTWLTGRGDCSERAALLVALAQSAGLTASVVEGLVYLDDPPRMAPHAWAELVLGGQVVPVDPTLGQLPADATHLPAPARQVARWCLDGEPVLAVGEPRRGG
jgi:transglutaminase-like putative cysteine protease